MGEMILRVDRQDISNLRFIIEGYDGLGFVTTLDPVPAQVLITYPRCREALLVRLIKALCREGLIREEKSQ